MATIAGQFFELEDGFVLLRWQNISHGDFCTSFPDFYKYKLESVSGNQMAQFDMAVWNTDSAINSSPATDGQTLLGVNFVPTGYTPLAVSGGVYTAPNDARWMAIAPFETGTISGTSTVTVLLSKRSDD